MDAGWFAEDILNLYNPETRAAAQEVLRRNLGVRADLIAKKTKTKPGSFPDQYIMTPEGREEAIEALTDYARWLKPEQVAELEELAEDARTAFKSFIQANIPLV